MTAEELINEFTVDQKIEFIRTAQSIYWTMTPKDTLKGFDQERLDNLFKFLHKNVPDSLMESTIKIAREV